MFDWNSQSRKSTPGAPMAPLAQPARDLGQRTLSIVGQLPRSVVPHRTYLQHPHVVARLFAAWSDPRAFRQRVDALLMNNRDDRQGFDFSVIREITALREHYDRYVSPIKYEPWGEVRRT